VKKEMTMSEAAAVRAAIDAWTAALGAKDAAGVVARTGQDLTLYALAPPLGTTGPDAEGLQGWFDTWTGPIGYVLADPAVAVAGDVAFVHGLAHMTGTKTDGEIVDLWFRATLGLRKRDGAWTIVHEHESVPFLMDGSFKAAVDLKP
jgi:PhnB protein